MRISDWSSDVCSSDLFVQTPHLAPEWRLLIITGFCGGLTTFSSFSAEIALLFQQGRFGVFAGAIVLHVGGSLLMTLAGLATFQFVGGRWDSLKPIVTSRSEERCVGKECVVSVDLGGR